MEPLDAVRNAVHNSGKSMRAVSSDMGRSAGFVSSMLTQGSIPGVDTMAAIGSACGYSLALVPPADLPPSAIVVDPPREG